jgi:hypothetical protein
VHGPYYKTDSVVTGGQLLGFGAAVALHNGATAWKS